MKKNTAVPHATPRHATPRHATPRHATPRHATPRHATPRHATPQKPCSPGVKFHFAHIVKPSFRSLLFLLAAGMFLFSCDEPKEIEPSSEASLTSLTLTVGSTDYEVTFTGTQHTLRVGPYGTEIPATVGVKDIVLSLGATSDAGTELSVTDNAVTLTVTAADGTTRKKYTITLGFTTVVITSFTFEVPGNENMALDTADHKRIVGKIDQEAKTITFDRQSAYVYRDKLKATFEVSEAGAKVQVGGEDQTSGTTEQDFSAPVSYVVSAEGTETTTYRVTLTKSTLATIPDDSFRAKLKTLFPAAFTEDQLDITHDDVINRDGLLDVNDQTPRLISLKGIEFFTALTTLNCFTNTLTSLDLRKNTALTILNCYSNSLTSLNVSGNTALMFLSCNNNALTSLDVSANTALPELLCYSNSLTSLNVSGNTALERLNCNDNRLTSLDVSANTALERLNCGNNSLTSLDMTGMRSVTELYIGTGTGTDLEPDNYLLAMLRVNTAVQDNAAIITMKTARGTDLTVTTVNNEGTVVCTNYTPADPKGTCPP